MDEIPEWDDDDWRWSTVDEIPEWDDDNWRWSTVDEIPEWDDDDWYWSTMDEILEWRMMSAVDTTWVCIHAFVNFPSSSFS